MSTYAKDLQTVRYLLQRHVKIATLEQRTVKVNLLFYLCYRLSYYKENNPLVSDVACNRLGVCLGILIKDTFQTPNERVCEKQCQEDVDCEWFSYDPSISECLLFISCTEISEEVCPSCITSNRMCKPHVVGTFRGLKCIT